MKEFETIYKEVQIGDVESIPVDSQRNVVGHKDAELIEQHMLEFRFSGEFVIGGVKHKVVYEPSNFEAFLGAKERYTSQAFYNYTTFTHRIFEADDEMIGAVMRQAYNKFYKSVKEWKEK